MQLIAQNLAAQKGALLLFSELNFSLTTGDVLLIHGPNGSGKSTLLRILAGLCRPQKGQITFRKAQKVLELSARYCHYLGPHNAMKEALSVEENLKFWQQFYKAPQNQRREVLEKVELYPWRHLPFGSLSVGQQRRVGIARLLLAPRPLWLLDEPSTALDHRSQKIMETLMENQRAHGLIIAATHTPLLRQAQRLYLEKFMSQKNHPEEKPCGRS